MVTAGDDPERHDESELMQQLVQAIEDEAGLVGSSVHGWPHTGSRAVPDEQLIPMVVEAPPCKHEWRQYMVSRTEITKEDSQFDFQVAHVMFPDGFFCKWCPAKSDENRVITNPEAL